MSKRCVSSIYTTPRGVGSMYVEPGENTDMTVRALQTSALMECSPDQIERFLIWGSAVDAGFVTHNDGSPVYIKVK